MRNRKPEKMDTVEILFALDSSKDHRGKRVIISEGMAENCLWPGDERQLTETELKLLGLTRQDQQHITQFFARASDWCLGEEKGDITCQLDG